jgi:Domain of unknown function (DUF4062)
VKVYLSSTFQDLRGHREAVDRTLRRMGHDVIGMEQYAAESSRPVERCLRDVRIADIYVLMLGWRYGYVPEANNPERLSITELEYREAERDGKSILAFLLNPETPWPPNLMDSASANAAAAQAISRFRAEVGAAFLSGIFTSPEDLASQVAAAVASSGLTTWLSTLILNRTSVSASDMGSFGTGGDLYDTSLVSIQQMIVEAGKDRAIVVQLGEGDTWWSTRLFLLVSLLRSLTQVRQIVFTGRGGRFAGMASPNALVEGLGARFGELDAFSQRLRETPATEDRHQETERQIATWSTVFAMSAAAVPPLPEGLRTALPQFQAVPGVVLPVPESQRHVGVREELLQGWLGERLVSRCIEIRGDMTMSQVQQVVDCLVSDVPLERIPDGTELQRPEVMVIDRDAFGLELAREWVRAGLPRNPAR